MSINKLTEAQITLINLAKEIAEKLGTRSLSPSDFRAKTNISDHTISREFGGWTELWKCADLEIQNRYAERSDDELLEEMRRVFETAGKRVNRTRFDALSKFSSRMYRRRWGNWSNALAQLDQEKIAAGAFTEGQQDNLQTNFLKATFPDDETAQNWQYQMNHLESVKQALHPIVDTTRVNATTSFKLPSDSAIALVRAAIDLLKQNPTAFLPELAELHSLVLAKNVVTFFQAASSEKLPFLIDATRLAKVARWLLDQEAVTFVALRNYLLPLDLLPEAIVDELNEWALDLIGEPALEEIGDEIVVVRSVLAEALSLWSKAADLKVQKE